MLGGHEPDAPATWRFSIDVARAWERAFEDAVVDGTRKVALRSAMTLSPDAGGVFDTLLGLVRHGLGGSAGDGRQFMSWIHYEDFIAAVRWLIDRDDIEGVVNIAAPNPLPNAAFMQTLREACGIPLGLPAKKWMLEIGAVFMRTETELILKSRRVVPARLLTHGFKFTYPYWRDAALDLCRQSVTRSTREPYRCVAPACHHRLSKQILEYADGSSVRDCVSGLDASSAGRVRPEQRH
jgi:uncharacterized protein (TIGR01777 family)